MSSVTKLSRQFRVIWSSKRAGSVNPSAPSMSGTMFGSSFRTSAILDAELVVIEMKDLGLSSFKPVSLATSPLLMDWNVCPSSSCLIFVRRQLVTGRIREETEANILHSRDSLSSCRYTPSEHV